MSLVLEVALASLPVTTVPVGGTDMGKNGTCAAEENFKVWWSCAALLFLQVYKIRAHYLNWNPKVDVLLCTCLKLDNNIEYVTMPNYKSNSSAQASCSLGPHTVAVKPLCRQNLHLHGLGWGTHIKEHKQNKPLGKSLPHLTASGWRHKTFNSLLHNYSFDVDSMFGMKGEKAPMCRH